MGTNDKWESHNAPNGAHIWCGEKHIADIVTDVDNPEWSKDVGEIAQSAILFHNNPQYRAATDLYEALKRICIWLDTLSTSDLQEARDTARVSRKAIAKAEGK